MRMFRQTHRRALWKPVIHDLLGLPETQESYCQSCYDMMNNIYTEYIYILSFHKSILIHARLVCFPKRFIYTVRLHLKTSSLFASLFGGGRPLTSQALKMNGVEQSRWSHELVSNKLMIDPRNYIHSLKLTVTYPLKNDGLACFCVISF